MTNKYNKRAHNSKVKVVHMTSAHSAFDDRIFHKEAKSLANAGFKVILIAPHNKKEIIGNIEILPIKRAKNRFERMTITTLEILRLALKEKANIYHFHDPDLLLIGIFIKFISGKKVIYDVHEDYKQKILSSRWINIKIRKSVSYIVDLLEKILSLFVDYIISADSYIKSRFGNVKCESISNFPPRCFCTNLKRHQNNNNLFKLIYAGGLSEDRGIIKIIESLGFINNSNVIFEVIGSSEDINLLKLLNKTHRVLYYGFMPWEEIGKYLINANVGLVLLQPVPAYYYSPGENIVKLFEYMSVGLPIIISNFPKLKKLISDLDCGITVDPTNPKEIAKAIEYLIEHPDEAKRMGENGRKVVLEKYNWEHEEKKLLKIYEKLLNGD